MKAVWRYTIALAVTVLVVALMALLSGISRERRHLLTCSGLDIQVMDSARLNFIGKEDVRKCLDDSYGTWSGQRLDSVNLRKIETILKDRSAILTSEAYTTSDGILHIRVTQREPVVRFQGPDGGFYSDENGFLFPLQAGYTSRVPIIDGAVPVHTGAGYKGPARTAAERRWVEGIIGLVRHIEKNKAWSDAIVQITVDSRGDIVMVPRTGKEKFIFGSPDDWQDKFARMERYYRYIAPSKEEGYYSTVNVKYRNQIICRK